MFFRLIVVYLNHLLFIVMFICLQRQLENITTVNLDERLVDLTERLRVTEGLSGQLREICERFETSRVGNVSSNVEQVESNIDQQQQNQGDDAGVTQGNDRIPLVVNNRKVLVE